MKLQMGERKYQPSTKKNQHWIWTQLLLVTHPISDRNLLKSTLVRAYSLFHAQEFLSNYELSVGSINFTMVYMKSLDFV